MPTASVAAGPNVGQIRLGQKAVSIVVRFGHSEKRGIVSHLSNERKPRPRREAAQAGQSSGSAGSEAPPIRS